MQGKQWDSPGQQDRFSPSPWLLFKLLCCSESRKRAAQLVGALPFSPRRETKTGSPIVLLCEPLSCVALGLRFVVLSGEARLRVMAASRFVPAGNDCFAPGAMGRAEAGPKASCVTCSG